MPNDPTLYPGIPNPQQRLIERIAALEARVDANERRRDIVITPVRLTDTSLTESFKWYGGRVWVMAMGCYNTTSSAAFEAALSVNSSTILTAPNEDDSTGAGLLSGALIFGAGAANIAGPHPGVDIDIEVAFTGAGWAGGTTVIDVLVFEWPQA